MITNELCEEFYKKVLGGIDYPSSFDDLEAFVQWYVDVGMPLTVDFDGEVTHGGTFSAIPLVTCGQYQVELYLVSSMDSVSSHAHPGVEVITFQMGGCQAGARRSDKHTSDMWMQCPSHTMPGEAHGGFEIGIPRNLGWVLLSFQKWPDEVKPENIATWWKGPTDGAHHEAMLERAFPGSVPRKGFADVSKTDRYKELFGD